MNAAMDIGVVLFIVATESVKNDSRFLGRGGIVKVNEGMAVDLLIENRKVGADFGEINLLRLRWQCRHGCSHSSRANYMRPSWSRAASVIMPWFHCGSQTTSTLTSLTCSS